MPSRWRSLITSRCLGVAAVATLVAGSAGLAQDQTETGEFVGPPVDTINAPPDAVGPPADSMAAPEARPGAPAELEPQPRDAPAGDAPEPIHLYAPDQLDELVGRIALYPDDLIAIVLPAATFPLQVVEAQRFLERLEHESNLEVDPEWDESVVALLNYPDVVSLMNDDLAWMEQLGEAVVNQQPDVLEAISRFRNRAEAAGNLKSDEHQIVSRPDEVIEIEPADPEVIYVPYYEPERVIYYQPAPVFYYYARPCPVYYYSYPAHYWNTWYGPFRYWRPRHFWSVPIVFNITWVNYNVHVHDHGRWRPPHFGDWHHGRHHWHGDGHHDRWNDGDRGDRDGRDRAGAWTNDDRHDRDHGGSANDRRHVAPKPARSAAQNAVAVNDRRDTRVSSTTSRFKSGTANANDAQRARGDARAPKPATDSAKEPRVASRDPSQKGATGSTAGKATGTRHTPAEPIRLAEREPTRVTDNTSAGVVHGSTPHDSSTSRGDAPTRDGATAERRYTTPERDNAPQRSYAAAQRDTSPQRSYSTSGRDQGSSERTYSPHHAAPAPARGDPPNRSYATAYAEPSRSSATSSYRVAETYSPSRSGPERAASPPSARSFSQAPAPSSRSSSPAPSPSARSSSHSEGSHGSASSSGSSGSSHGSSGSRGESQGRGSRK